MQRLCTEITLAGIHTLYVDLNTSVSVSLLETWDPVTKFGVRKLKPFRAESMSAYVLGKF